MCNVASKPTDQSHSHSISRVPLQVFPTLFFYFRSILKIKGSSHKEKILNFHFSQKWLKWFSSNFVGLLHIWTLTTWHYLLFPQKFLSLEQYFLIFSLSHNVAPKPTDQSCSTSIFRIVLQLSPASPFHYRPSLNIKDTLMLRVVHIRNKKRSNKHGILQTWSIVIKSSGETAKKVLLSVI